MTDPAVPKPPAKTTAQRQAEYRAKRAGAGLVRVPNVWAHPDDHPAIQAFAAKLIAKRKPRP